MSTDWHLPEADIAGPTPGLQTPSAVRDAHECSAPQTRIPDFFLVGHQKCGTTALWAMLRGHPEIFMPDLKEPRFLAPDMVSRFGRPRDPWGPDRRPRTLEEYLSLFACAGPEQRAGEASPEYLRSELAAARIAELQPDARIIAILREPASFVRSFHLQFVSANVETERDLRKALALEAARSQGKRIPRRCHHPRALLYSEHVRYVDQLRRFYEVFAPEQVLVLIYDDFRADNEGTVRRVLRFLDVGDTLPVDVIQTKPVKSVRMLGLHHLAGDTRRARERPAASSSLSRAANALIPTRLRRSERFRAIWRRAVYRTPPVPDEKLMLELRRRYEGEVLELSEYLERDLVTLWGYDQLG